MICLTPVVKCLALIVSVVGGLIGYLLNVVAASFSLISLVIHPLVVFSGSMWFIPFLSTRVISSDVLGIGQKYHQLGDTG